MKHGRLDYNRIKDPLGLILESEPVFLMRAQDCNILNTMARYIIFAEKNGSTKEYLESVSNHMDTIRGWQKMNSPLLKVPDLKNPYVAGKIMEQYSKMYSEEIVNGLRNDIELLKRENHECEREISDLMDKIRKQDEYIKTLESPGIDAGK